MSASEYPPNLDTFTNKVDEDVSIQESVTIPSVIPFTYQLQQVPKGPQRNPNGVISLSSVYIRDFREIEGTPQQSSQYNVDYNSGIITFNPLDKNKNIVIQYLTAGNNIEAADFNKIQDAVLALEKFAIAPTLKSPDGTLWYLKISNTGVLTIQNQP